MQYFPVRDYYRIVPLPYFRSHDILLVNSDIRTFPFEPSFIHNCAAWKCENCIAGKFRAFAAKANAFHNHTVSCKAIPTIMFIQATAAMGL